MKDLVAQLDDRGARIKYLFALVVIENGIEGVLRRDTVIGTQPWITDTEALVAPMLERAMRLTGRTDIKIVTFVREERPV